ncbi:DEAD-box ATP-dependent RNA helicase 20-like [Helicoverpa zea]|uniref:DEAD-box ATP-dependent RNA helicase 20-like n=1 Tax=Helicoverpa zea TaxID=7113 RepID=UPI001F582BC4|nr:DEAD-box ATP-dependent RNA helicase 20-like [Helicoverpa zea]
MALNILTKLLRRRCLRKLLSEGSQFSSELTSVNLLKTACIPYSTVNHEHILRQYRIKTLFNYQYYSTKPAHQNEIDYYRNEHNITVIGEDIPSPYMEIEQSGFPDYIKSFLKEQGFSKPTVIQSQGWPIAMSGQNFVGIAQTGTGKTLAYLLPAVVHIKEKKAKKGLGPIVLVLAPTRELARQIEEVAKDFEKSLNIRSVCVYGGASRSVQAEKLRKGVDILIATPGRLNDFIVSKTISLSRSTYVVLDEADRMLDMGFEPQIRQALEGVPLERQILMFSATWPKEVRHLAKDYLGEFVQVNVGSTELSANHNIKQHVHICDAEDKMNLFKSLIHEISGDGFGKMLIFSNTKKFVDTLALTLRRNGWPADGIHGDKTQLQRDKIINKFKSGGTNILVATDVAARGLDVDGVTHVINYDFPNTSEDYIHRIGRTGRQENKGVSHTILTDDDARQAKSLIDVLKEANQQVPQELEDLARSYDITKEKERQSKWNPRQNNYNKYSTNNYNKYNSNNYNKYNTNKKYNRFKNFKSSRYDDY